VAKIIEKERPDGIIAGIGGQTGLNITSELSEMGVLEKYNVEVLGTSVKSIQEAEDRDLFKKAMERVCEPVPKSVAVNTLEEAKAAIKEIGLPLVVRPAYTLGGSGGGIAQTEEDLLRICELGLKRSRISQVLLEQSVGGWTEVEYEVMRDSNNTCITICNMENMDPMGIHTGESIVATPIQTLSDEDIPSYVLHKHHQGTWDRRRVQHPVRSQGWRVQGNRGQPQGFQILSSGLEGNWLSNSQGDCQDRHRHDFR
jgi:carbamoyl-phosphate synthase large subunit